MSDTVQTYTVTDNRTGKTYEVPVKKSREGRYIFAKDIGKIEDVPGNTLRIYDPAYMNTIVNVNSFRGFSIE